MKINKIILENIRSYKNEEVVFDKGITLLSGDIGSGKTTTLIAIEFALFGLIKGKVSSDSLLRHGTKHASVIVDFDINNKNIIIKRSLVKSGITIKQEPGTLTVDGIEETLTPQELRARIVDLLGYPSEFISKSPAVIYRYTVYTPQEDMKLILFESSDSRLETIRKIFDIDKYKIIRNNLSIYLKELNARIREDKAKTADIDKLSLRIDEIEKEKSLLSEKISILLKNIEIKDGEIRVLNAEINKLDEKILEQHVLRQKIVICNTKISSLNSQKESIINQIKEIEEKIKQKPNLDIPDVNVLVERLVKFERSRKEILDKKQDYLNKKAVLDSRLKESNGLIESISALGTCPTCKQEVPEEHKFSIKNQEKEKINSISDKLDKLSLIIPKLDEKIKSADSKINEFQESISKARMDKLKIATYSERLSMRTNFESNVKKTNSDLIIEKQRITKFSADLDTGLMSIYDKKKELFREKQKELKNFEVNSASHKKEFEMKQELIISIKKDLDEKKLILENIVKQVTLRTWLDSFFLKLMQTIERHVLNSILKEFNEYFKEWFGMLIEDENLSVSLDDSFTPIIEQNGYETFVQNLSGGEKTSVALAYRLALNKVINDFVSTIRTKGFLILDEPTDGFSSNQLDKLRDVLMQIKSDQIIIVSHESKLESYADKIIKVSKEHHISCITQ